MKLSLLLNGVNLDNLISGIRDVEINSVVNDSRKAKEDSIFIAYSGYAIDVHSYIKDAYEEGCRFFVIDSKRLEEYKLDGAHFIGVEDTKEALSIIAKNFYEDPTSRMKLIGITGTSGKTTTTFAIFNALRWMGKKAGLIGTIEYRINDKVYQSSNTTPDILDLYELISKMKKDGVEYLVMEVSSHSLALGRVDGLNFDICGFTNFSQDHLDFHHTMEEYLEAKLKIVDLLESSSKKKKVLLVNKDIDVFGKVKKKLLNYNDIEMKTISLNDSSADYHIRIIKSLVSKTVFSLNERNIEIGMCGITNIYNFSFAVAVLKELGFQESEFAIPFLHTYVKGRMERVQNNLGISVIIDYAHKPDALEKVLKTIKEMVKDGGRIITVFGCGGDRDKLKRPIMGKIAGTYSDYVIITSDNPRTENPFDIIKQIEEGIKNTPAQYEIIENRKEAIFRAIELSKKNDCILIAGKGHEDYQIIGKEKFHFSDKEVVLEALRKLQREKGNISSVALQNLLNSVKFSISYSIDLLKENKKRLVIENIIQILKDIYMIKNNQSLHESTLSFAMEFEEKFDIEDLKLISKIERGIRTKKEFYDLNNMIDIKQLEKLYQKFLLIFKEIESEFNSCN